MKLNPTGNAGVAEVMAKEWGVSKCITFMEGKLTREQMRRLYAGHVITLLPTQSMKELHSPACPLHSGNRKTPRCLIQILSTSKNTPSYAISYPQKLSPTVVDTN